MIEPNPAKSGRRSAAAVRRRRAVALAIIGAVLVAVLYLVLAATLLAPTDTEGARVERLTVDSRQVGEKLGVNVVVPAKAPPRGERSLLLFLHGRGGSEDTFTGNEAFFRGLARQGRRAPVVAFPDGGESSYWHNRDSGRWDRYVMREVIPRVSRRFGVDRSRVAVGGISMGGFGAYNLALKHPRRFCAAGGHSAALWLEGGETAPGAFDDAADFERNDVLGAVRADPDAFGSMRVWNDYGRADPFRPYNESFVSYLRQGDTPLSAHVWPGGHEGAYWDRHWPRYLRFYANSLARC